MPPRIGPKVPHKHYLARWRDKRGLTQEQLAARIGTTKGQISNWENNKRGLNFQIIGALAEALDIEPGDLFRDPDRPSADQLLRGASPAVLRQAIELVEVLIRKRS